MSTFTNEEVCKEYFRDLRIKQGVVCKKCGSKKHYWLQSKWQFQCSECSFRTTLRSGTVMENSRLPLLKWFLIMLFMTSTKKGMSACELQKQLGHTRYMTIWSIMHRLRNVMGKRDDMYKLQDMIEFDEGYFEKAVSKQTKSSLKRGRGSQRQTNVAVMAESVPLEFLENSKKSKQCRYFKMKVLETHNSEEITEIVKKTIHEMSIVFSDKSTSYVDIAEYVDVHISEISDRNTTIDTLKWVHIAISNAKRNFLGVYHKINGIYLQNYLNEFVYKLNRRYMNSIFERLIVASIYPYWQTND
mgnify:CR=1 FL=1